VPTIGLDCNITLRNPNVNLNQITGFRIKADSLRILLPKIWYRGNNLLILIPTTPIAAGKRVIELTIVCATKPINRDGTIWDIDAETQHDLTRAFASRVNESHTLVDPAGVTYTVGIEEMEDRYAPGGGDFLLRWESRFVFVEV